MARSIDLIINTVIKGKDQLKILHKEINMLNRALANQSLIQRTVSAEMEKRILTNELVAATTLEMMRADTSQMQMMVETEIRAEALNIVYQKRIDLLKKQRMEVILLEMVKRGEITAEELAQKIARLNAMEKQIDIQIADLEKFL